MKTLMIVCCLASLSYADQASDSFFTGFANALNQQNSYNYAEQQREQVYERNRRAQELREEEQLRLLRHQIYLLQQEAEAQRQQRSNAVWKK